MREAEHMREGIIKEAGMNRLLLIILLLVATVYYFGTNYAFKSGKSADGGYRMVLVENGTGQMVKLWGK